MAKLWVLTEERPKLAVLERIFCLFAKDSGGGFIGDIRIIPILDQSNSFSFTYEVIGLKVKNVDKVFLKTITGTSSFVDYLIYHQDNEPTDQDQPIYAIEETKTDDSESRNTGVFQRGTKFVLIKSVYPEARLLMLYNLQVVQKEQPTDTNIFGTRCFKTLGVEIIGKNVADGEELDPFNSVDELIEQKNGMKRPPAGNVPILLKKVHNKIFISGKLEKSGRLAHDPNIGALSLISASLRALGWKGEIVLTRHGLTQGMLTYGNKMLAMCREFNVSLEGLTLPPKPPRHARKPYWRYENKGEKLGTIFIHLVVESFTNGSAIFENHAGCEKGYFINAEGEPLAIAKYVDTQAYKQGDKTKIIHIPDLILVDPDNHQVINIEGKQYQNKIKGIEELANFDAIENLYIKPHYPNKKIIRTVVLYGGTKTSIKEVEIGFLLNANGILVLGPEAPALFDQAIKNLIAAFGY